MSQQTVQQRGATRPQPGAKGASVSGPQQARLADVSATLNAAPPAQRVAAIAASTAQPAANKTGLPDRLKAGVEALSGLSMDHVRVHRGSAKPAQLNAHAYAQGSDIHLAPGQDRHLPHEAWHVVQQAQGRVRPTLQMQQGVSVNDDRRLEREADVMGARALRMAALPDAPMQLASAGASVVQRAVPQSAGLPKPVPVTSNYHAQVSAKNTMFTKADYPRSKFSFGIHTRNAVLSHFTPTGIGHTPSTVTTTSGHQANTQSVQLDHNPQSWDKISDRMDEHNAHQQQTSPFNPHSFYTLWDARMYYNDTTNLRPATGSDNASGGADGAHVSEPMPEGIRNSMATAYQSITHLQAVLNAYHQSFTEDHISHVGQELLDISERANALSEQIASYGAS